MRHALGVILFLAVGSANAAPVTWTLDNVIFDDGASATGSFVYDAITDAYSGINILTGTGDLPGYSYTDLIVGGPTNLSIGNDPNYCTGINYTAGDRCLRFFFGAALTDAGGSVNLNGFRESRCLANNEFLQCIDGEQRDIVNGSVIASVVPVPAAVWLFGSGLGLLGWSRRRAS